MMSGIDPVAPYRPLELLDAVNRLTWDGAGEWRRRIPFSPHKDSETIFLRKQPSDSPRDALNQLECEWEPLSKAQPFLQAIHFISNYFRRLPARAMLVRLQPGGEILRHTDIGRYAELTDRYHLPIQTNAGAWFEFEPDGRVHMKEGIWYSFNKHIPHAGGNDGDEPRIHLIVDLWKPFNVSDLPG